MHRLHSFKLWQFTKKIISTYLRFKDLEISGVIMQRLYYTLLRLLYVLLRYDDTLRIQGVSRCRGIYGAL